MAGSGEDSLSGVKTCYDCGVPLDQPGGADCFNANHAGPVDADDADVRCMGIRSFSQLASGNRESPTLGSARREQARDRRADFRRGLRLMAGLFLLVMVLGFVAGMLVGSIMEAVQ